MSDVDDAVSEARHFLEAGDEKRAVKRLERAREAAKKANDVQRLARLLELSEQFEGRFAGREARAFESFQYATRQNYRFASLVAGLRDPGPSSRDSVQLPVGRIAAGAAGGVTPSDTNGRQPSVMLDRVPRTAAEVSLLLAERPPGWEYLFFGSVLFRKKNEADATWREHQSRHVTTGAVLSEADALEQLQRALRQNTRMIKAVERHMSPRSQQRAFGLPGKSGNPARISRLAEGIVAGYEDLLSWSAGLRATPVPARFRRLFEIASETADAPLGQFRNFIDGTIMELDRLPQALQQQHPFELELVLHVELDEEVMQRYHHELERLQQEAQPIRLPIPEIVRQEVWRRDQGRCVDCGSRIDLEFDHIIPVSKGGANTARNIELRCEHCNRASDG